MVSLILVPPNVAAGPQSLRHKQYVYPDRDLASHLIGRWDWTTRSHPCGDSTHVIAFSADRKTRP
jgi:hypothetical protein